MTDIWDSLGSDVPSTSAQWLYRYKGEVRGPIPFDLLVTRLERAEISLEAEVAREGGDFYPMSQVKALAGHLPRARRAHQRKTQRKVRMVVVPLMLLVLGGGGAGGYMLWQDIEREKKELQEQERQRKEELAARRKALEKSPDMALVGLVSLGTREDVKFRPSKKKRRRGGGEGGAEAEPERAVSSCQLTQQDIFGTLRKHLAKINVCVQDEKKRDTQGLLPSQLPLDFVVRPDGKVVDFQVNNRHFRKGPMNNCMLKAFRTVRFPKSDGSNCPVTIPIKIGN